MMPARKRQLILPLPHLGHPPRRPEKRARRDYTAFEFVRALVRNGFEPRAGGLRYLDTTGACREPLHGIYDAGRGRISRRATLALLIRERERLAQPSTESQKESQ